MLQHPKGSRNSKRHGQQSCYIIEQKMCTDERKVWSQDLEREGKPATLHGLMNWMTVELKPRMRATAPVRTGTTSRRPINHVRTATEGSNQN